MTSVGAAPQPGSQPSDGGRLCVRTLTEAGISTIFALHGLHIDPLLQACIDLDVKVIDTRHEAAAGHAAEGWARSTGTVGVAAVTAGPGFANVLTSLLNAHLDRMPVLYIVGAAALEEVSDNPMQGGYDQVAVARSICKWAHRVSSPEEVGVAVAQALQLCRQAPAGPVLLELPMEAMFGTADVVAAAAPAPSPSEESSIEDGIGRSLELLAAAKRPVILAGGGAMLAECGPELTAFAQAVEVPVASNTRGSGLVAGDHPLCAGPFSNVAQLDGDQRPDFVLLAGARAGMFTGGRSEWLIPQAARVVHIEADAGEIGKVRPADVGIVGDCREVLAALGEAGRTRAWPDRSDWLETVGSLARSHAAFADQTGRQGAVHPYFVAASLIGALDSDAIVAADGAESFHWTEMVSRPLRPGSLLAPGYLSCLGTGLPFAIGAQVAWPDRQVVCVVGDGALGLNIQELDTLVRHDLPVTVVVFNNRSWGASLHGQQILYGRDRTVASELGEVRYEEVAAGFGCWSREVADPDEVKEAIRHALAIDGPALLNVWIDPDVSSPRLQSVVGAVAEKWY